MQYLSQEGNIISAKSQLGHKDVMVNLAHADGRQRAKITNLIHPTTTTTKIMVKVIIVEIAMSNVLDVEMWATLQMNAELDSKRFSYTRLSSWETSKGKPGVGLGKARNFFSAHKY